MPSAHRHLDQARAGIEQRDVVPDDLGNAGPQYLDRDLATVVQAREMHLRNRRAGDRTGFELGEHLVDRPVVRALERGEHEFGRERRHLVLQLGELVGDVRRQQIAARRQELAEFDEDRTQRFQREPQAYCPGRVEPAAKQQKFKYPAQTAHALMAEYEFVESEPQTDGDDFQQPEKTHARL